MSRTIRLLSWNVNGIRASYKKGFLDWLADGNFVFFGYRYYNVSCHGQGWKLELDPSSGLGLLREAEQSRFIEATIGRKIRPTQRNQGRSPIRKAVALCAAPRPATAAPLQAPSRA